MIAISLNHALIVEYADRGYAPAQIPVKRCLVADPLDTHRAGADPAAEPPAGFYTLSSASVERDLIGGGWLKRNAPAQVPVILLGVLGVDSRYQGSGLGRMLLHDASLRALSISDSLGAKALVVDPVDGGAEDFYARHGFERIPGLERMFVPLSQPGR